MAVLMTSEVFLTLLLAHLSGLLDCLEAGCDSDLESDTLDWSKQKQTGCLRQASSSRRLRQRGDEDGGGGGPLRPPKPPADRPARAGLLRRLLFTWAGRGVCRFPTSKMQTLTPSLTCTPFPLALGCCGSCCSPGRVLYADPTSV